MKRVGTVYAIILMIAYLINSNVLKRIYPNAMKIFQEGISYKEYMSYLPDFQNYYILRGQIYEVMFFLVFLLFYLNCTSKVLKGVTAFILFLATASVIDKCFLDIYEFVLTDYIVILCAIIVGIYKYFKTDVKTTG